MIRNKRNPKGASAEQIKAEILVTLRNIILFRHRLSQPTNSMNIEEIHRSILSYAGAVYHFKDRMIPWCKKNGTSTNPPLKRFVESSTPLLVCGDLYNTMKHGARENRSNLSPTLSGMSQQTFGEPLRIRYDGLMKTGEIGPAVPYHIEILSGENATLGNDVRFISRAFCEWLPVLKESGLLRTCDPVEARILEGLEPFAADEP